MSPRATFTRHAHTACTHSCKIKLSHTYTNTYNTPSQKPSDIHPGYIAHAPHYPGPPPSWSRGLPLNCGHGTGAGSGRSWTLWINPVPSKAPRGRCPIPRSRQSAAQTGGERGTKLKETFETPNPPGFSVPRPQVLGQRLWGQPQLSLGLQASGGPDTCVLHEDQEDCTTCSSPRSAQDLTQRRRGVLPAP